MPSYHSINFCHTNSLLWKLFLSIEVVYCCTHEFVLNLFKQPQPTIFQIVSIVSTSVLIETNSFNSFVLILENLQT